MRKAYKITFIILFALALFLRVSLALVNREANDDHMEVVRLILRTGSLPIQSDCWECFQPKLYHATVAGLLRLFSVTDAAAQIVIAQLLNALAGGLLLWVTWRLIRQLEFPDEGQKLLAFGLIALNPALVAINVQATNDTFAITFSGLAIYYAVRFLKDQKTRYGQLALALIMCALGIATKTNVLVTALAIFGGLVLKAFWGKNTFFYWIKSVLIFTLGLAFLVLINPLGQYIVNYQRYGSPVTLTINIPPQRLPDLFQKTDTYRPGILSIQDGFFTFKFLSLLEEPQITSDNKVYPAHRTSFWTILYGRAYFIQYTPWPPSWNTTRVEAFMLGRVIYILALIPTLILLIGFFHEIFKLFSSFQKRAEAQFLISSFFLITVAGYFIFLSAYALEYRLYTVIKTIFVYPALPAFAFFYLSGGELLDKFINTNAGRLKLIINIATGVLIVCFVLDIIALLLQLTIFR